MRHLQAESAVLFETLVGAQINFPQVVFIENQLAKCLTMFMSLATRER